MNTPSDNSDVEIATGHFTIEKFECLDGHAKYSVRYNGMTVPEIVGLLGLEQERFELEWRQGYAAD